MLKKIEHHFTGYIYLSFVIIVCLLLFFFSKKICLVISLLASMSKNYMVTHDLGIYLYNITNVFHGNKP